jgi:predicted ester cyclase
MSGEDTRSFWPAWFKAFPDGEFEATRTIAAEKVVVVQWTFFGTHLGALGKPIIEPEAASTGRIVCFRGVSIYDVKSCRIRRETTYLDQATVLVEIGVTL